MEDVVRRAYGITVEDSSLGVMISQENPKMGGCITLHPDQVEDVCEWIRTAAKACRANWKEREQGW